MIRAEHAQSDRMRGSSPPEDHWSPYAGQFRADPRRVDDAIVDCLLAQVDANHTVIDVGAGGGRLALPLALHCRRLTAVEPSASMASVLLQQANEHGIRNISLVQARWEEAEVEAADIVLCAHVLYTVQDIGTFVRKLESHARQRVLIVLYDAPPQSQIYPLWKVVNGEERLPLPSLPQLEEVLGEMGIAPQVDRLAPQAPRGFDSLEQATEQLSRRLYVAEGSPEKRRLEEVLPRLLSESDGAFQISGVRPLTPALVWWKPASTAGA